MIKKIEAIIREEALDTVKDALRAIGIVGMNVVEVRGHGRQGGINLQWRGTAYQMDMIPKIMISIVLSDRNVKRRSRPSSALRAPARRETASSSSTRWTRSCA